MTTAEEYYEYPQETWDEKTCKKWAKYSPPADHWGNKDPKGLINHVGSHGAEYGQVRKYNGGCVREGKWYPGEIRPLPVIHEDYEFYYLNSWGLMIRPKTEGRKDSAEKINAEFKRIGCYYFPGMGNECWGAKAEISLNSLVVREYSDTSWSITITKPQELIKFLLTIKLSNWLNKSEHTVEILWFKERLEEFGESR